jgi:hypothetical protein
VNDTVQFIFHDEEVIALLQSVEVALSPMALSEFMAGPVASYLEVRVAERFASEGDDVTGKWAPLAAATQAIRSSLGYGSAHPINVRTGEMLEFVSTGDAKVEAGGASYTMPGSSPQGDLAAKMELAQNGGVSESGRDIPARPVLGLNMVDLEAVVGLLESHIAAGGSLL